MAPVQLLSGICRIRGPMPDDTILPDSRGLCCDEGVVVNSLRL